MAKKEKKEQIGKHILPQKLAASIIAFIGFMLMVSNLDITGSVIGGDSEITAGIIGVFFLFFALLLFFRPLKKKF